MTLELQSVYEYHALNWINSKKNKQTIKTSKSYEKQKDTHNTRVTYMTQSPKNHRGHVLNICSNEQKTSIWEQGHRQVKIH